MFYRFLLLLFILLFFFFPFFFFSVRKLETSYFLLLAILVGYLRLPTLYLPVCRIFHPHSNNASQMTLLLTSRLTFDIFRCVICLSSEGCSHSVRYHYIIGILLRSKQITSAAARRDLAEVGVYHLDYQCYCRTGQKMLGFPGCVLLHVLLITTR